LKNSKRLKYQFKLKNDCLKSLGSLFFYICALIIVFTSSAYSQDKNPQKGGAIVEGVIADSRTLVPILASDGQSAQICSLLFNGLLKYDKDINLVGDLAQDWLIKVFLLKKGIKWHDGKEFTAEDVKFTYEKLIDPTVKTPYSGDFLKIKGFNIIDPYTIEVRYDEPFAPALSSWGMWIMPKHILEEEDLNTTDFSSRPIGTGPYRLKEWHRQERIELIANLNYFEGAPFISRDINRIIPDQASIFLELQTNSIDSSSLTPLQFTRQTDSDFFSSNYKKYRMPGFGYTYLGYNLKDKRFKDKRVRQALNFAIDKEEIIKIVLLGLGKISTGPFVPQSWAYNQNVKFSEHNPAKAMMLLEESGWKDSDKDGYLDQNGRMFEFTIITNQGNEQRLKTAQIIQRQLKEVGIKVKIKVLEWSSFISEYIDKRRFEAILLGWSLSRDPDCFDIWHSSKTKEGEFNFIHYKKCTSR